MENKHKICTNCALIFTSSSKSRCDKCDENNSEWTEVLTQEDTEELNYDSDYKEKLINSKK